MKSADDIREQLKQILLRNNIKLLSVDIDSAYYSSQIRKAILAGFFTQVAHLQKSGNYMVVKDNQVVAIHPSSTLDAKPQFCVYHEFILTTKNYIRIVSAVRGEWLFQTAPEYFKPNDINNVETRREMQNIERDLMQKARKTTGPKKKENNSNMPMI